MRRGGYDVRVLPEEDLGWEENPPPTLIRIPRARPAMVQGEGRACNICSFIGRPA